MVHYAASEGNIRQTCLTLQTLEFLNWMNISRRRKEQKFKSHSMATPIKSRSAAYTSPRGGDSAAAWAMVASGLSGLPSAQTPVPNTLAAFPASKICRAASAAGFAWPTKSTLCPKYCPSGSIGSRGMHGNVHGNGAPPDGHAVEVGW